MVASGSFDACRIVSTCQQYPKCPWLQETSRVRHIDRRVYLESGPFFYQQAVAKRNRQAEGERGRDRSRGAVVVDWPDREEGSATADEIVLPCILTSRPATACICFLFQQSPGFPACVHSYIHAHSNTHAQTHTHLCCR